jgi:hypothetical protein
MMAKAPSPVVRKDTVFQRDMQGQCRFTVTSQTLHISLKHRVLNATNEQWDRATIVRSGKNVAYAVDFSQTILTFVPVRSIVQNAALRKMQNR